LVVVSADAETDKNILLQHIDCAAHWVRAHVQDEGRRPD
jgi:hypothetical protein